MEFIKKFFKIEERGSSIGKEVTAGITTFLAMAYILFVNPNILADTGLPWGAGFTATAIAAIVGCLMMGLVANFPVAQAPGMGMNAFFTYTVCLAYGLSYQEAFALVLISGILFLIISISGLRKIIIDAIPQDLKLAIGAGIGLFIAYVGLQGAGIIVSDSSTVTAFGDLTDPTVLLAVFGLFLTVALYCLNVKGAILLGIVGTAVVGIITGQVDLPTSVVSLPDAPQIFAFVEGFKTMDYSNMITLIIILFSMLFLDFFDTAGTLISVGSQAGLVDENNELIDADKALLCDATATIVGAVVGTSSTTSYVESLSGIEAGGRTGLTAIVVALGFFIFMFLSPLLAVVTSACTAPALIFVGILMAKQLGGINWSDSAIAITAFLVVLFMPLTYSVSQGIAIGFVFYPVSMICTKRAKQVNPVMYGLFALFILYFIVSSL